MITRTRLFLVVVCALCVGALAVPSALAGGNGSVKQGLLSLSFGNCSTGATVER